MKSEKSHNPVTKHTNAQIEEKHLGEYIIMHGNVGRTSNSSKMSVMHGFLEVVGIINHPNGRSADPIGHMHYFLPKFTTIQMPKMVCAAMKNICGDLYLECLIVPNVRVAGVGAQTLPLTIGSIGDQR